ncbi:MAG: hypothetical protein AAGA77_20775, partial [Bacteroidota bacterium]
MERATQKIIQKIQAKFPDVTNVFTLLENLTQSELNSFLLELFRQKSEKTNPTEVLKKFNSNRFVAPSQIDPIQLKELEIVWLKCAKAKNFSPIVLSPVTTFGTSSSMGFVNQNKVITALRGTEVVSDATNVLALKIAHEFKNNNDKDLILRYTATHRHIRGQYFSNPNFTAHFSIMCLVSGGYDKGNYKFEINQLEEHIELMYTLLKTKFDEHQLAIKFLVKKNSEKFQSLLRNTSDAFWSTKDVEWVDDFDNKYYQTIQFKIDLSVKDQTINIVDGGDVDWTQKLLNNRKHRLFI